MNGFSVLCLSLEKKKTVEKYFFNVSTNEPYKIITSLTVPKLIFTSVSYTPVVFVVGKSALAAQVGANG